MIIGLAEGDNTGHTWVATDDYKYNDVIGLPSRISVAAGNGDEVMWITELVRPIPDGIFGILTKEAVEAFQKNNNLTVDGIVGPATLAKLFPQRFKKSKRIITELIVHCSATPEGRDYTVEQIRKEHIKQGWSDIGYHYVIYRDGTIVNGRDIDYIGAHCSKGGHNTYSIGICYIGGVANLPNTPYAKQPKKDTRTDEQKLSLRSLLYDLKKLYPNAKIYGHHDFDKSKDCPSFDAKKEYERI
jgi:N-acetylmuramoyl-L-alanine amidase